jgi:hypothetical protein
MKRREPDSQRLRVGIPTGQQELVRALRIRAGVEGRSVQDVLVTILEEYLCKELKQAREYMSKEKKAK